MFNSAIWLIIKYIILILCLLSFNVKVCQTKINIFFEKMVFQCFVKKAITPIKFQYFWKLHSKQSVFPFILSEIPSSFLTGGVNG